MRSQVLRERLERGVGILTGGNSHRDACTCGGHELVRRFGDPGGVDPEDRDSRLHPHPVGDPALADELDSGAHADLLPQLLFGQVERVGLPARDALDRDVPALVV